jgi:hypothetical protein
MILSSVEYLLLSYTKKFHVCRHDAFVPFNQCVTFLKFLLLWEHSVPSFDNIYSHTVTDVPTALL